MASESTPQLKIGYVIQTSRTYWAVTQTRPDGSMTHALQGYEPGNKFTQELELLISQGGHTIANQNTPNVVGEIPLHILQEAAHRHIDRAAPPELRHEWHERVRRWS